MMGIRNVLAPDASQRLVRHHGYVSARADAVIAGCGTQGYLLGLERMARLLETADN